MYVPEDAQFPPHRSALDWIDENPFGIFVGPDLHATHLPFLLHREDGARGTLHAHLARANPHWHFLTEAAVRVVFPGPHHYISPTWYDVSLGVPTWNYVAVHVTGTARLLEGDAHRSAIEELVHRMDPGLWGSERMPHEVVERLLPATAAICIEISEVHAKAKLGQHRSAEDQRGVVDGLRSTATPQAMDLLRVMEEFETDQRLGHDKGPPIV